MAEENKTDTDLQVLQNLEKAFFKNNPKSQKRNTEKSLKWFSQYIPRSMNRMANSALFRDRSLWADKISPGTMLFFEYDPIHKDTLPVYDRYPLTFMWDTWRNEKNGKLYALGINIHYLRPALRFMVMKALLKLRTEKRYRKSTKLQISWKILQGLSESKYFEHSIKMYRLDHVRTKFVVIPATSWEIVAFLPTARFMKGGKSEAWKIK